MTVNKAASSGELSFYQALAEAALEHYALGAADITFVQHNAGLVFHVITRKTKQHFVLKIHKRVGVGNNPTSEELEPGLQWLADFAQANDVTVQTPICTYTGQFVGHVFLPPDVTPVACTLQQWVDGCLPRGDFSVQQAYALGKITAKLHAFSSTYKLATASSATHHDVHALHRNIRLLRETLPPTLLSSQEYSTLLAAEQRITELMAALGRHSLVWGPIHGDIHYDNVLLYEEEVRLIDFTGLRLAHYLYDIGVTMYHIFHQGSNIRRSYFSGYNDVFVLPRLHEECIEAFIAYAAIDNLAWNCTLPEQVASPLFRQNMNNLIHRYCRSVAHKQSFLFS